MTALGNTKLLERVSSGLVAIRNLFSQFDINKDNVIERDEFARVRPSCHASSTALLLASADSAGVQQVYACKGWCISTLYKPCYLGPPYSAIGCLPMM